MAALDFSQFASQPSFGERYAQGQQQALQNKLTEQQNQMQMRAAQNQNALAQYQLSSAQREDASTNALNTAYQNAYDPATGKIDSARLLQSLASSGAGSKIPGVQKSLTEAENALLQRKELEGKISLQSLTKSAAEVKLLDDKLKQSRGFLDTLDPAAPDAGARYLAWHEANHADPIIGPALAARGANADQSRAAIQQAIDQGPQALANQINQSKLGAEKFMEMNKPTVTSQNLGGQLRMVSTPGLGGAATVVPGSTVATTITPGQLAANQIAQGQLGVSQGQLRVSQGQADTSAGQLRVAQDRLAQEKIGSTAVPVQDPNNPSQMILVNPREYKGGGLGAPGVIGLTGKTPAATAKQEATDKGIAQVASVIDDLRANYNTLNAARAIPSTERSALSNLTSSAQSSSLGQFSGRVFGTEEQSARDVINSSRLMLLNGIKQATGLSATQLNSNMELTTWLKAVSDPSQSIETVDKILGNIEKFIATGGKYSAKKDDKMAAPPAVTKSGATASNW